MATLKKELRDILDRYEIDYRDKDKLWDCHGTLVLYHKAYEQIAAKEKIAFDAPLVLEANGAAKSVALCVVARMGDRAEWATGEAAPGNNKNAYPYAMAEKRAKDRAVAKLVGLAAYVLSEDEADEFKTDRKPVDDPAPKAETQKKSAPAPDAVKAIAATLAGRIKTAPTISVLDNVMDDARQDFAIMPQVTMDYLNGLYEKRRTEMREPV